MKHAMRSAAAVVGVGSTPMGVFQNEDAYTLGLAALSTALDDAGMQRSEVDAVIAVRIPSYQPLCELAGISPRTAFALSGQGRMSGVAIELGTSLIASGAARTVALVYGNDGRSRGVTYGGADDRYGSGNTAFWKSYGMTSPGAAHAVMFSRHQQQYGTDDKALGEIAVTFREHAALNPAAVMRKRITAEEYAAARFVAEPLRLFDYCLINDGGVAIILSESARARDAERPPVYIRGAATGTQMHDAGLPPEDYWHGSMQALSQRLYRMADMDTQDMSALMIYDNFTPTVLFSLEGFGYCGQGESGAWVQEGHLRLGGRYPANTSGGHLSESYMQGWGLLAEGVRQIRGECGARQVAGTHNIHYMCAAPVSSSIIFSDTP